MLMVTSLPNFTDASCMALLMAVNFHQRDIHPCRLLNQEFATGSWEGFKLPMFSFINCGQINRALPLTLTAPNSPESNPLAVV